jgi:acetylornithine deacetylase/succinyl-diaminopimelate desuccinylase-like protein
MIEKKYKEQESKILDDYISFLKFESISSEPAYKNQVEACCEWLKKKIESIGLKVERWDTPIHPILFAEYTGAGPDKPTLLIYNHYDVQPVDPLEAWKYPPFTPTLENGQIYARGASDNKGQCFYTLQALRLLMEEHGKLPINIKWVIEGEEEMGSDSLFEMVKTRRDRFKADHMVIVDMGIHNLQSPAVTLGVRGIITMDVNIVGSKTDLHSGSYGGVVFNPLHALIEILGKMRDSEGRIQIPGFYDGVKMLSQEERADLKMDFDLAEFEANFATQPTGGEKEFTPWERAWLRPTIEINGLSGGYSGEGFKTVIPANALAKVSCRLVPGQEPKKIYDLVKAFIEGNAPPGVKVTVNGGGLGGGVLSSSKSDVAQAFSRAYTTVFKKPCAFIMDGGTIPIITELAHASGAEFALVGVALPTDQIHAPNEHFGVDRLRIGTEIIANALVELAK